MSTRLKRKLGELGVDPSSARANESFCLIGTPLPPLEKSKDNGEFVPLWKQDVRDEQGRRRLHGAFTGGFSAGYFNTVGSKEGWTPATFTSSRTDRAKQKVARPEDYMDEEDVAQLKDGQGVLDTTEEMDLLGGTRAELNRQGAEEDSIATALEESMLPAPKDSVGARILKKMGWRLGQGIGPRLTWRQRKRQDMEASSSQGTCIDNVPEDDEEASKHTYAPRDTPVPLVARKDNFHGLGYVPGMGLNESLGVKVVGEVGGPKLSAGFGLGALNDAEDDDVDVYDGGVHQSRNRMAYDASERDNEDGVAMAGRSERDKHKNARIARSTSSFETFRDGRQVLAGFVLSDKPVAEDRWFPLPAIPKGWTPDPNSVWEKDKENSQRKQASSEPTTHAKWKASMSFEQRGNILGETPLPIARPSVFDYISQKDRERLKNVTSDNTALPGKVLPPGLAQTITIPPLEPHIAQAALRGFQPFTSEPPKQTRYTAYLNSQSFPQGASPSPPPPLPHQSIDLYNKELDDYAKAAMIFKPISGAMASRFTSAAVVEQGPKVFEGLHTPSAEDYQEREEKELERKAEETPKVHAARMNMYGPMTREVTVWIPAKLLCKRFGVKDPNPEPMTDVSPATGSVPSSAAASASETDVAAEGTSYSAEETNPGKDGRRDLANVGLGEDDDQGRDTLTYERPPMDIFKAIFASDDEESDDEGQKDNEDEGQKDNEDDETPIPVSVPTVPVSSISVVDSPQVSYQPSLDAQTAALPEKIDIGSFKPTFIPRDGKLKKGKANEQDKPNKEKKKRAGKVLVSFELDEDGAGPTALKATSKDRDKERPKKKKRKERKETGGRGVDEDDGMWVEKPRPEVVKDMTVDLPLDSDLPRGVEPSQSSLNRGRKRAIDFM